MKHLNWAALLMGVWLAMGPVAWAWGECPATGGGEAEITNGQPDPRIEPGTGRDVSNWPPDRPWDHQHIRLELVIEDMESKVLRGRATIRARAVGEARRVMVLDAGPTITVRGVRRGGRVEGGVGASPARTLAHRHDGRRLVIEMDGATAAGAEATVEIEYEARDPSREGSGLVWLSATGVRETDARPARPAQMYSQGQSEWNHLWFPCHDFPHDKVTSEIIATVPAGLEVISNGRLVSRTVGAAGPGARERWHWSQERPHSTYLVSLVVGTFERVEVGGPESARPGLEMPVYGPAGSGERLREVFANTPRMVAFLERYFDEPYPWAKYAQVLVRNFRWGGMENTSASTLGEFAWGGAGSMDDLIVHELGHQWMGNLVTCASWEHLWLNEGWATFIEWLWAEAEQGEEAYLRRVKGAVEQVAAAVTERSPRGVPLVSRRYATPDEPFEKADDPYAKGALLLHVLRERVGAETFRRAAAAFIDRHAEGVVETDQFRRVMEEVSGRSLEREFDRWCRHPGLPRVEVDVTWVAGGERSGSAGELVVTIEQTPTIDAENPAYGLEVPVEIEIGGKVRWEVVRTDERRVTRRIGLPAAPERVRVDHRRRSGGEVIVRRSLP